MDRCGWKRLASTNISVVQNWSCAFGKPLRASPGEFSNTPATIKLRFPCSPPSLDLNACDKGPLVLFKKNIPALPFYLPLTVCHPVIEGASPPTVPAFYLPLTWPRNNMKPGAGFPAARLEGLFDSFKIWLASKTLERCRATPTQHPFQLGL